MIVVDTSLIYALLDARDGGHEAAQRWYEQATDELVTTPLVLAELDYLVRRHAGPEARRAFRRDVAAGGYVVEWWATAPSESAALAERYADLGLSLTDATLVVLAARLGTSVIGTFDVRHFRVVRPLAHAAAFTIVPADMVDDQAR